MSLKVVKLIAENVKGLKAVEITPNEYFQLISGRNGQGKSSVLDSIWFALGGGDAMRGTDKPIHDGAEQANVTLDLGDYVVIRKWKGDKTTLEVKTKEGAKFSSPQKLLDDLIGRLSFDPLAFANQDEKSQLKTLLGMIELSIDPVDLDKQRKDIFEQRTFSNREVKRFETGLAGLNEPDADTPEQEVSALEIMNQIQTANVVLTSNNQKRLSLQKLQAEYQSVKTGIEQTENKIANLARELEAKKLDLQSVIERNVALNKEVENLIDPDFDSLKLQLTQVEVTNQKVRDAKAYKAVQKSLAEAQEERKSLTTQIEQIDKTKEDALKTAKFPIDDLGFTESGVTFGGIPFKQCSTAEQLKVSIAMAMALNPKLRVIRIRDGSLLDEDNMQLVKEMCEENDYQAWVEVVDSSGKVGIYIEAGEVKTNVEAVSA